MAEKLIKKNKPDEVRPFKDGKGKVEIFQLGEYTGGRAEFEPGWKWSLHVKPIAGTPSCQASHTGYCVEGRMMVKMDDGSEKEYGPGDFYHMEPGHDAWVVGNKKCVMLDFSGMAKYAKKA